MLDIDEVRAHAYIHSSTLVAMWSWPGHNVRIGIAASLAVGERRHFLRTLLLLRTTPPSPNSKVKSGFLTLSGGAIEATAIISAIHDQNRERECNARTTDDDCHTPNTTILPTYSLGRQVMENVM